MITWLASETETSHNSSLRPFPLQSELFLLVEIYINMIHIFFIQYKGDFLKKGFIFCCPHFPINPDFHSRPVLVQIDPT